MYPCASGGAGGGAVVPGSPPPLRPAKPNRDCRTCGVRFLNHQFPQGSADCFNCRASVSSLRYFCKKANEMDFFQLVMCNAQLRSSILAMFRAQKIACGTAAWCCIVFFLIYCTSSSPRLFSPQPLSSDLSFVLSPDRRLRFNFTPEIRTLSPGWRSSCLQKQMLLPSARF